MPIIVTPSQKIGARHGHRSPLAFCTVEAEFSSEHLTTRLDSTAAPSGPAHRPTASGKFCKRLLPLRPWKPCASHDGLGWPAVVGGGASRGARTGGAQVGWAG